MTALLEYLNLFAANNGSGGHTYKASVYKLQQYGIKGGPLFNSINVWTNRQQHVISVSAFSTPSQVNSVLTQGSILEPLLFLLYNNDLQIGISSTIRL